MKVRNGYLDLVGRPWQDEFAEVFVERGCTGVLIGAPGGPPIPDVSFLTRIPGLRGVSFFKGVKDVSAVSRVAGLRSLSLPADYKGPFQLDGLEELESLEMPYLPAVPALAGLTGLRNLMIWFWPRGVDLSVLGPKPELEIIRVEFKRGAVVSSAVLAGAPKLRRLSLYAGTLTDVTGLSGLSGMKELHLYGTKVRSLAFVAGMPALDWLHLENSGEIDSLAALRGHPALRVVSISGRTNVLSGDLSPLLEMPAIKEIALERGYPHYSHKPEEVRKAEASAHQAVIE